MHKRGETVAATRNQPARRVKRAMSTIERAAVENSPRNQPARRIKRAASTTVPNVTRRDIAVADITPRYRQGTYHSQIATLFISFISAYQIYQIYQICSVYANRK